MSWWRYQRLRWRLGFWPWQQGPLFRRWLDWRINQLQARCRRRYNPGHATFGRIA